MPIRIEADDRVTAAMPDEEIYLPGPTRDAPEEGPFAFVFPRIAEILRMERQMSGLDAAAMSKQHLLGVFRWLADGFGPDAWAHIQGRLDDEVDLLDDEHLMKLYQLLTEQSTGRPTTSSGGVSRQPWKKPPTAAPSAPVSVSGT